jgi:SAM-dependent methyltransferase
MNTNLLEKNLADYDVVGDYKQDRINGFQPDLIYKMIESSDLKNGFQILDAMAGNGNLTAHILKYCQNKNITNTNITTLEFSEVQCEIARKQILNENVEIFWGDILTLTSFQTGKKLPLESYDRILLKSANHEIPQHKQDLFYKNLFSLLKPGGKLIMLGFIFEDEVERNEFAVITKFKDTMAGMKYAAENRHFSTRNDINQYLKKAGFINQSAALNFEYTIHSEVALDEYFKQYERNYASAELQSYQVKALTLRKNGRIRFHADQSTMSMPAEITITEKPTFTNKNIDTFKKFPTDILGKVKVHIQMLQEASKYIKDGQTVLDIGCGSGLLTNIICNKNIDYKGLDISNEFIELCNLRFSWFKTFSFEVQDIHDYPIKPNHYDVVSIMNTLYLPGMKPVDILRNIFDGLKPGGKIIVSGPSSINSLRVAQEKVFNQLREDGFTEQENEIFNILRYATENLMTKHANYYSAEGMAELLLHIGFTNIHEVNNTIYYNNGYLVCAEK